MLSEGFIDIHIHVIPDVDDGAANMRMALDMLYLARKEGITSMICTPHYGEIGKAVRPREYVDDQFAFLKQNAAEHVPDVSLYRGNELFFVRDIPKKLAEGRACTMNGTEYVLVEFEPEERARDVYDDLCFLQEAGYKPILAHAERIFDFVDNSKFIKKLTENGVLLQVNSVSLLIERIRPFKKLARLIADEGLMSFLSTDAHGTDYRVPFYLPAVEWLYSKYDDAYVTAAVHDNAERLLLSSEQGVR